MGLDTTTAVLIALAFLMPGFIASSVLANVFRRRSGSAAAMTLQYLTFSCLNLGLWSWLIVLLIQGQWLNRFPLWSSLLVFIVLFVSPLLLGLALVGLSRKKPIQRALSAFGFKLHRFIPTAWDFKFQQEEATWVIVRLKDGSSVYGFLGVNSFAGDEPGERDLYLEALFTPGDSGHWQPVADTGGILINAGEIAMIEFRRMDSREGDA